MTVPSWCTGELITAAKINSYVQEVHWTSTSHTSAQCDYCGLYGMLGRCEGCGAPNKPVENRQRFDMTCFGDEKLTFIEFPPNRKVRG